MNEHILHVDMNAFFASVEQSVRPELRGKPVIVCGDPDGRGVVSAASYEARKYGVHSAMAAATARRLCPDGIFVSARGSLYVSISRQIFDVFRQFTPLVSEASIDEAFLDVKGSDLFGSPVDIARQIKQRIRDRFSLTCSIGIAENKLLAKMASDMQKPDGLVILARRDIPNLMWPLPCEKLYGIGRKTAQKLAELGIMTIGQLASAPVDLMVDKFGLYGRAMVQMANGEGDATVDITSAKPKSLGHEVTFARDVSDLETLHEELLSLSEQVASRLRSHRLQARAVSIKYRYPDFRTFTRAKTLEAFVDTAEPLFVAAKDLLDKNVTRAQPLRLIGVTVSSLVMPDELRQAALFDAMTQRRTVHQTLDRLRERFGKDAVVRGSKLK